MNTILDILGASVIGGLIMLTLIMSLTAVTDTNVLLTRELAVQQRIGTIETMLLHDLYSAGRGVPDTSCAVLTADSAEFIFIGDENCDSIIDTIRYANTVASGRSKIVRRAGEYLGDGGISFTYYTSVGAVTSSPSAVRSVGVSIRLQDDIEINGERAGAFLQRRVYLRNIR